MLLAAGDYNTMQMLIANGANILMALSAVLAVIFGKNVSDKLSRNQGLMENANEQIQVGNTKTDDLASTVDHKLSEKTDQLRELNAKFSALTTENGDLRTENGTLKAEKTSLQQQIEVLKTEMSTRERVHTETAQLLALCQTSLKQGG